MTNFREILERRRVIMRNSPRDFAFVLWMQPILLVGCLLALVALFLGVPHMMWFVVPIIPAIIINAILYNKLWHETIANIRANEPDKVDLVLKA